MSTVENGEKRNVVCNRAAKILYPIYTIVFIGGAIGCWCAFRNPNMYFDEEPHRLSMMYWIFALAIIFFVFSLVMLVHTLIAYLCKGEHDYLRISSKCAIIVVIMILPLTMIVAGGLGDYKYIFGNNYNYSTDSSDFASSSGSSFRLSDSDVYYKYAFSQSADDTGTFYFEHNIFGTVSSFFQNIWELDEKYTKNTHVLVSFEYERASNPYVYDRMLKVDTDFLKWCDKEKHDNYVLYKKIQKNDNDTYDLEYHLLIEADQSYYYANCQCQDFKGSYEEQFVQKALSNYKLLLEQEKEVTH